MSLWNSMRFKTLDTKPVPEHYCALVVPPEAIQIVVPFYIVVGLAGTEYNNTVMVNRIVQLRNIIIRQYCYRIRVRLFSNDNLCDAGQNIVRNGIFSSRTSTEIPG